jgi:peptide chain release factor subunit 1
MLDLLRDMLETKEVYGLVVMDRREGDIAYLKGKTIIPLTKTKSNVPGKTKAGGQSAHRFERLREAAAKDFFNKIGEMIKDQFLGNKNLRGIIVGGPGPTKYDFVDGSYIPTELKNKIIGIKDLSYTGDFGLQELLDKSEDILSKEEVVNEKQIMAKFFNALNKNPGTVSYGRDDVLHKLKTGAVDELLLSEDLDEKDIEMFEKEAEQVGTTVHIISTETREGVQLRDIGMIAAILRYEVS